MDALSEALDQILDHVAAAYNFAGISDYPTRRYISPGEPPADCELVAVWAVPRLKEAAVDMLRSNVQRSILIHQADITIQSWLCVPTGTPPTQVALDTAGRRIAEHLFAVWFYLGRQIVNSTLISSPACSGAQLINGTQIVREEGAFAGWRIDLRADLTGLLNEPSAS